MNPREIYRSLILFTALSLCIRESFPQAGFSAEGEQALQAILSLDTCRAGELIRSFPGEGPGCREGLYLANYLEFIVSLVSGDALSYVQYRENSSRRIRFMKGSAEAGPTYAYFLSGVYLQTSLLNMLHGERTHSLRNFLTASGYIHQNEKDYPGFSGNRKILGLEGIFSGLLPPGKSRLLGWFGVEGDPGRGLEYLEDFYRLSTGAEILEASILLNYAYYMTGRTGQPPSGMDNILNRYLCGLRALHSGRSDEVAGILGSWNPGNDHLAFPFRDLILGEASLNLLMQGADEHLLRFIGTHRGGNFLKTAWHKLSWYYFLGQDTAGYERARQAVLDKGMQIIDPDRQAYREALDDAPPDPVLLRSRLLYDGGRYADALEELCKNGGLLSNAHRDSLEYVYRKGRIFQALGRYEECLEAYRFVISRGSGESSYFAPQAALQSGIITEERGEYEKAGEFYRLCLKINHSQYRQSIRMKAEQGLERIGSYLEE